MKKKGQILVAIIIVTGLAMLLISALTTWAIFSQKISQRTTAREEAFQIAEAGIEYYRWHLAHQKEDYQDGQNWCCGSSLCEWCGPYVHDYRDNKDKKIIGQFILRIKPPSFGSTVVTIESEGKTVNNPLVKRKIETKLTLPSLAQYVVCANDKMYFREGTEVFGPIHSNDGIRFDGLAHGLVTSAKAQYDDPSHYEGQEEFGVHTHKTPLDPYPPNQIPDRPDVFKAGRQFPELAVDFAGIIGDLAQIKNKAQENGYYFSHSGILGYRLVLKTNDTFNLYKVLSLRERPVKDCQSNEDGWGIWSIKKEEFINNYPFPANGLIFVEDNLWVDGQIQTARLTIASGRFPENPLTDTSIIINNDLLYTTYDGQDMLGLLAQKNINVGLYSDNDLQIDAALIAKNGRVGRYYYDAPCGPHQTRKIITLNGMLCTNKSYGFGYEDNTGYQTVKLNYDTNLLDGSPPSFPLTSDQYLTISWREIR